MIETKEKTIDGRRVTVSQFPARKALTLKVKLIKLFGPSLAQLFGGPKKMSLNSSIEEMAPAIEKLSATLEPEQFLDLVLEMLTMTRVDGREVVPNFDMEFTGNLLFVYKIAWYVIEVNYGNFFGPNGIGRMGQGNTVPEVLLHQKS
jgi:hypothetical protein